jgi:hypothetical protein
MPMTEKDQPGEEAGPTSKVAHLLKDDRLAGMISNYLDGELHGIELEELETLLRRNESLVCQIGEMRLIERQLGRIGADILSEPIPEEMLEILSRLPVEKP